MYLSRSVVLQKGIYHPPTPRQSLICVLSYQFCLLPVFRIFNVNTQCHCGFSMLMRNKDGSSEEYWLGISTHNLFICQQIVNIRVIQISPSEKRNTLTTKKLYFYNPNIRYTFGVFFALSPQH